MPRRIRATENDDLGDRLESLFEKTNDPEDFLSFTKIQSKVQHDGCTASKTIIGRALTKLGFEAVSKKFQVELSRVESLSKSERKIFDETGWRFGGWRSCENFSLKFFFAFLKKSAI